jgi:two-component system, NtrC family, nitrogen regulation response regulator GlnG
MSDSPVAIREQTTEVVEQGQSTVLCGVLVRVHDVPASPAERLLDRGSIVLGAGLGADVIISNESVSRRHLQVTVSDQGIEVVDLNSRNGTYYQGQRVGRLTLDREATIALGRVNVTLIPQMSLRFEPNSEVYRYGDLLVGSPAMRTLVSHLEQLDSSTVPLLIEGDSGTGKELLARSIHQRSPVCQGPFVAVNCAAIDHALIRSELFGHCSGAFASATDTQVGAFELAAGGTLFLDDVDEVPVEIQPMLLQTLETQKVVRWGESLKRDVSVRLITSTRRNLAGEVEAGRFRADLLYRLNVVAVRIPNLKDRLGDVALLANHFASEFGVARLPPKVVDALELHTWPGNVRELRNVIRGYAALGELPQAPIEGEERLAELLRRVLDINRPYHQQKDQILNQFIDVYLSMLLDHTRGNQSEAARVSGIDRAHLNKMIAKLRRESSRPPATTREATQEAQRPVPSASADSVLRGTR